MRTGGLKGKEVPGDMESLERRIIAQWTASICVRGHFIFKPMHFHCLTIYLDLSIGDIWKGAFQGNMI